MKKETNLNWEEFEPLFGTWSAKIKPFFDSGGFDPIYKRLKDLTKRGKKIAPLSTDTFRCFIETPYDDLKVIMMGLSPYHTFRGSKPVADGLLMSCSSTNRAQPSLDQFYKALMTEFNYHSEDVLQPYDLSYLAHQGVLLFNASLTVEKDKAGSHLDLWEPFTRYIFEHVVDTSGVPIIFLGKEAAKFRRWVAPFTWSFEVSHPASAAYQHMDWDSEQVFTNVSKILKGNNNIEIKWIETK